jgi:hypothetical protein
VGVPVYANNSPYKYIDPDGRDSADWSNFKNGFVQGVSDASQSRGYPDVTDGTANKSSGAYLIGKGVGAAFVGNAAFGGRMPINASAAVQTVEVSRGRYPQSAQHIEEAQAAGHPRELTIDRAGARQNRRESLSNVPVKAGSDRDEYPPAMTKEGGIGASVRHIAPSDNRGAGACIGAQCRGLPDGAKIRIKVVD